MAGTYHHRSSSFVILELYKFYDGSIAVVQSVDLFLRVTICVQPLDLVGLEMGSAYDLGVGSAEILASLDWR